MCKKLLLCCFFVCLAWLQCLPADSLQDTPQAIAADLEQQIQNLQDIEQTLQMNSAELQTLRQDLQTLQQDMNNSQTITAEQSKQLAAYKLQVNELTADRAARLKNFKGLLELCAKYKQESETFKTTTAILGGVALAAIALAILAVASKKPGT